VFSGEVVPGAAAGFAALSLLCGRPGGGVTGDGVVDAVVAVSALSVSEARARSRDLRWIACPGAVTALKPGRGWLDEGACSRQSANVRRGWRAARCIQRPAAGMVLKFGCGLLTEVARGRPSADPTRG
jgi:hypothetical protein